MVNECIHVAESECSQSVVRSWILICICMVLASCSDARTGANVGPYANPDTTFEASRFRCYNVRESITGLDEAHTWSEISKFRSSFGAIMEGSVFRIDRGRDHREVSFTKENWSEFTYNFTGDSSVIVANSLCQPSKTIHVSYRLSASAVQHGAVLRAKSEI